MLAKRMKELPSSIWQQVFQKGDDQAKNTYLQRGLIRESRKGRDCKSLAPAEATYNQ